MRPRFTLLLLTPVLALLGSAHAPAADGVVPLGAGSYTTELPKGAKAPQETIYRTANVVGKTPTNDWWSSLAWMKYSERQYPHPLAVQAESAGLRVYYPGPGITANRDAIFGAMPAGGNDLVLGHSAQDEFPDARLDGYSDWFVSARFASGPRVMTVTYGHGSPFVYAVYEGGDPCVTFAQAPRVWSGGEDGPVLGVSVNGRHYGLFGPSGSTWDGLKGKVLTNHAGEKHYFSLAVLPDDKEETLTLFKRYAYCHVTDTRVDWSYDPKASSATTTFTFHTTPREGDAEGTLFALYPHQWRNLEGDAHFRGEYDSVRGKMKLAEGKSFRTTMRFPGVLPVLPNVGGADKDRMTGYLKDEVAAPAPAITDTYADGKWLGKTATLAALAEVYGQNDAAKAFDGRLRTRLEEWFTATAADGRPKGRGLFYYDDRWGTLIGYPASYGSDVELNDHHFHYGYFIRAAAEVARRDPAWAADAQWGGMVKLLIRDIADPDRKDTQFPFLRNFDPYAGHSWASGHARFGDGNNQESSSEAMNAWAGLVLWGDATGDEKLRNLGIYLYTTEMNAIDEYWFDVHGDNFPKGYTPSGVAMVWGGKGANGTWFSARPEHIHGINWLPFSGASLYLGRHPEYAEKNYAALAKENGGTDWAGWADLILMYRALSDPADAAKQYEAAKDRIKVEAGNSRANLYYWICTLNEVGRVDADVTADYPLYAVFKRGKTRTYCVYNRADGPRTVTFSDGFRLKAEGKGFSTAIEEK